MQMSYAKPKFTPIKYLRKIEKNVRGNAMALSHCFATIISFGHSRIEKICKINKKVTLKEQDTNAFRHTEIYMNQTRSKKTKNWERCCNGFFALLHDY